jgi:prevent-host-death family protein
MTMDKIIAAGEFKAKCLHLLDEVAERRAPLVITKRGKPVAKLVPIDDDRRVDDIYGCMAGTGRILGDIVSSPLDESEWGDADIENVLGDGAKL